MSMERPKRKATANRNYSDSAHELYFEQNVTASSGSLNGSSKTSASKSPKRKTTVSASASASPPAHQAVSNHRPEGSGEIVPFNWQPPLTAQDKFSHKLDLTDASVSIATQVLNCPNEVAVETSSIEAEENKYLQGLLLKYLGQKPHTAVSRRKVKSCLQIKKGDFIYMVSEPPGEPYYIGRVMGFQKRSKPQPEALSESASNYMFQIQWFYRPRDISKQTSDSRLLFASMHSDTCPISSFRGLATVLHRSDVDLYYQPPKESREKFATALEYYSSFPNCFYFDKLFDRYMIKFYEIIKTSTLLQYIDNAANNSKNFILALNKRYEFVFMEAPRTKAFINNFNSKISKHCDICAEWCPHNESVTCAGCEKHFHMLCLDPPLLKKPSRGFSWSCALCSKKHELEHQSKKMLMLSHDNRTTNEEEIASVTDSLSSSDEAIDKIKGLENILPKYEVMAMDYLQKDADISVASRRLQEEWPLRYLGLHVRLEDAVDPDDRSPYPRASTSLGARFQATNIPECNGHPIVYYDPDKSSQGSNKRKGPNSKKPQKKKTEPDSVEELPIPQEFQGIPSKEFPHWLQPRPKGYIERGEDDGTGRTCTLLWKSSNEDRADDFRKLDSYMAKVEPLAIQLEVHPNSPNFVDAALKAYLDTKGNVGKAYDIIARLTRSSLNEPTLSKEEIRKFEAGVKKFGSELYPVFKEVKSQPCSMIVRFYYLWKKTKRGQQIWGNFSGRKKKASKGTDMKIQPVLDDYADSDDDSAFENDKIVEKRKLFRCKHCKTYEAQRWYKITGFDGTTKYDELTDIDDIDPTAVTALCYRCAKLWRRYAVYWEDPEEVERKNSKGVGGYRRKVESELIADAEQIIRRAEEKGVVLSYEVSSKNVTSSVISSNKAIGKDDNDRTQNLLPIRSSQTDKAPDSNSPGKKNSKTVKKAIKSVPRTTNRAPRNNSLENVVHIKGEQTVDVKGADSEKKRSLTGKGESKPNKKRKSRPENQQENEKPKLASTTKIVSKTETGEEHKVEVKQNVKRQRKNADTTQLISPIFNPAYKINPVDPFSPSKFTNETPVSFKLEALDKVMKGYKQYQLCDMKSLIQGWQAPQQAKIDLLFDANERNCCVCLESDYCEQSLSDMLICSHCGVNVHSSCAGINISGKVKPVKQWLCEACINDLGPMFSTAYSCSLCFAKSSHRELSILGCQQERPDYLVPIIENGKWCHLICALYCYSQIAFRNIQVPSFVSKEVLSATNTRNSGCMVENTSRVFAENCEKKCGICSNLSGGLVKCDACPDGSKVYHVTCAQDTPNFKLGFKLASQSSAKSAPNTIVNEQRGVLVPILLCAKHNKNDMVFNLRDQGKRSPNGELKPLIQLFLDDLSRTCSKLNGPQLRTHNYISMVKNFMRSEFQHNGECGNGQLSLSDDGNVCAYCRINSSPKWWPIEQSNSSVKQTECNDTTCNELGYSNAIVTEEPQTNTEKGKRKYICQNCHKYNVSGETTEEKFDGDMFMEEINSPLNGENFGVKDMKDRIFNVYRPIAPKIETVEQVHTKSDSSE